VFKFLIVYIVKAAVEMENDFSHLSGAPEGTPLRSGFLSGRAADPGGDQGSKQIFTLRAAVQTFTGDNEVAFSLRFVLFLIGARAAAAAEYYQ
jgi:hypothetical protein